MPHAPLITLHLSLIILPKYLGHTQTLFAKSCFAPCSTTECYFPVFVSLAITFGLPFGLLMFSCQPRPWTVYPFTNYLCLPRNWTVFTFTFAFRLPRFWTVLTITITICLPQAVSVFTFQFYRYIALPLSKLLCDTNKDLQMDPTLSDASQYL